MLSRSPDVIALRGDSGVLAIGTAAVSDLRASRAIAESMAAVAAAGPVELVADARSPGGVHFSLRIAGVLEAGVIRVAQADERFASAPFDELARCVARPLAELSLRLFPPPELVLHAGSPERAEELARIAPERCRAAGPIVRCGDGGEPAAAFDVLDALAASCLSGWPPP